MRQKIVIATLVIIIVILTGVFEYKVVEKLAFRSPKPVPWPKTAFAPKPVVLPPQDCEKFTGYTTAQYREGWKNTFKKENKLTEPEFNMYITINDVLECARICNNHNIIPLFSFMIGIPGEQREEIINTVKLMKQLRKICPKMESGMAVFMPYPGGELYSRITQERNFIEPKSLREWCKEDYLKSMDSENVSVSWNKNDEKYILDIHYYANLAYIMTKNQYKEMAKKNFIIASGLLFFVMLARMRWNMNFFSLAFDRRIYLFTKRVLNIL